MELSSVTPTGLGTDYHTLRRSPEVSQTTFHGLTCNGVSTAKHDSSPNEYEDVEPAETGLHIETRSRHQTENPLYEDHGDLPVVHPTLKGMRSETKSDATPILSTLVESFLDLKEERMACGGVSICFLFVALLFTLLISVGALILVALLCIGVYDPPTNATMDSTLNSISELNSAANQLSSSLDILSNEVAQDQTAINTRIESLSAFGSALNFSGCQTTEYQCTTKHPDTANCITGYFPEWTTDRLVVNTYCAVTSTVGDERNPMVAALMSNPLEGYYCSCQIIPLITPWPVGETFVCSLFVTTCPVISNSLLVRFQK